MGHLRRTPRRSSKEQEVATSGIRTTTYPIFTLVARGGGVFALGEKAEASLATIGEGFLGKEGSIALFLFANISFVYIYSL